MSQLKSHYMPSEIARLVLGYLKDSKCTSAYNAFLEENKYLSEYKECLAEGIVYPTEIAGKTLTQILNNKPISNDAGPSNAPQIGSLENENKQIKTISNKLDCLIKSISTNSTLTNISTPSTLVETTELNTTIPSLKKQTFQNPEFKTPVKQVIARHHVESHHNYTSPQRPFVPISSNVNNRNTPRKSVTPRKINLSETTPKKNPNSNLTSTPSKNGLHVEPNVIVGELINNPAMPDLLADAVNKILNGQNPGPVIENLATGSWSGGLRIDEPSSETNDESVQISLPEDTVKNILSELEKNPAYSEFVHNVIDNFDDFDDLSSIGSSPFIGESGDEIISNSLSTPKGIYGLPLDRTTPLKIDSRPKNIFQSLSTPDKKIPYSPFASSPFVSSSSPFVEPNITPGKIFAPDFNVLTSSPPQQPHIVVSRLSTYLPILPPPVTLSIATALTTTGAVISPSRKPKMYIDSNLLEEAKLKTRKILPRGKTINAQKIFELNKIQPKRKATDLEIRTLLSQKPKIAPRIDLERPSSNYVSGRNRKRTFDKVTRSLDFNERTENKIENKKETKSADNSAKEGSAKIVTAKIVPGKVDSAKVQTTQVIDPKAVALLKNLDSSKMNEIISRVHKKINIEK